LSLTDNVKLGLRNAPDPTPLDLVHALDRDAALDRLSPMTREPTALERSAISYHEAGHAFAGWYFKCTDIEARVRGDGTGVTKCSKISNPVEAITFHLAGSIAETRYNPAAIHKYTDGKGYDFMAARLLIDQFNKQHMWPALTCQRAAQTAVDFVKDHWDAISNLGLALNDAGSLDDHAVRIFASCGT
jgi:hypothetical protein